ncbi:MAG: HD domain-containing protein [Candidatus Phytoplasma pyri]|uniref:HD domain-containing protein n=1 Tax=Candidatus Phytoplasma pyri TaxID=47566 RepID=UPI003983BB74
MKQIKQFNRPEVFRDPIYGYIYLDYIFLEKLIDTKAFQRLRRIRQLGCANIVFHSAEHSRFTHSLGVYELSRRFLEFKNIKKCFSERERLLLMVASLMHDIGHGAYSHIFEKCFHIKHEKKSAQIIIHDQEISNLLDSEIDFQFKYEIASIILKEQKFPLLEQILTSQLDIDRLDYLERDSYFTGAIYGHVDTQRLMRSMIIKNNKIVFKESSIYAIENYLINRYHMYWQVYHHPKIRSYLIILEKIYIRIKYLIKKNIFINENIAIIKYFIKNKNDLKSYLEIDDYYINGLIISLKNNSDEILSNLCNDFLNRKIWCFLENNEYNQKKIKKILIYYKKNNEYYTAIDDVNHNAYDEKKKNIGDQIFILNNLEDKIQTLKEKSYMISKIIKYGIRKDSKFFYRPLQKEDIENNKI